MLLIMRLTITSLTLMSSTTVTQVYELLVALPHLLGLARSARLFLLLHHLHDFLVVSGVLLLNEGVS
jgi:hypothetical protein